MESEDAQAVETTKVITFAPPLMFNKGSFNTITLREPMAGEVRKAEGQMRSNMTNEGLRLYNMHLIASVSGVPFPVVELMPVSKFNEAANYLAGFTSAGPEIGEN